MKNLFPDILRERARRGKRRHKRLYCAIKFDEALFATKTIKGSRTRLDNLIEFKVSTADLKSARLKAENNELKLFWYIKV
jgi:hypothetical protein